MITDRKYTEYNTREFVNNPISPEFIESKEPFKYDSDIIESSTLPKDGLEIGYD